MQGGSKAELGFVLGEVMYPVLSSAAQIADKKVDERVDGRGTRDESGVQCSDSSPLRLSCV